MSKINKHTEYTDKAIKLFAEAIDYAANACHYNLDVIIKNIVEFYGYLFDNRDKVFLDNYNGEKIIKEINDAYFWKYPYPEYKINENSKEYILGEYLGELAAYSRVPFRDLLIRVKPTDTLSFLNENNYELSQDVFDKWVNKIYKKDNYVTRLSIIRKNLKLSQAELSKSSGVNIRNIQMYEQRNNDINAASGIILKKLARALHVRIDDLLESEL